MSSKVVDWAALVKQLWGPAFYEPDVVYQQSNGREFKEVRGGPGIYSVNLNAITQETTDKAQGRPSPILTEDLGRLLQE